jgi:hypothetical protein
MPHPKPTRPWLRFDAHAIIRAAGGPTALCRMLDEAGLAAPSVDTAFQWSVRGEIPKQYLLSAVYLLLKKGYRFADLVATATPEQSPVKAAS